MVRTRCRPAGCGWKKDRSRLPEKRALAKRCAPVLRARSESGKTPVLPLLHSKKTENNVSVFGLGEKI